MGETARTALDVAKALERDLEADGRYGMAHAIACFARVLPRIEGMNLDEVSRLSAGWAECAEWALLRLQRKGPVTKRYAHETLQGVEGLKMLATELASVARDLTPRRVLIDVAMGSWKKS